MEKKKILVVEDDDDLNYIITCQLQKNGYAPFSAKKCEEAEQMIRSGNYDLILLDVMLPDGNGMELCKKIREYIFTPIIFISCLGGDQVVQSLRNGGDDYLVKPVDMDVLLARIEANIRRDKVYGRTVQEGDIMVFRQFKIDLSRHIVWRMDEDEKQQENLHLSPIEYKLLQMFITNEGNLMTYEEIYQHIWKTDDLGDVRTVMVHVSNLRKKINYLNTDMIQTIRGTGYVFHNM